MQLQMTAPLDIGLEQSDAALGVGQEDVFDLGETEKHMNRRTQVRWLDDEALDSADDSEESEAAGGSGDEDHVLSADDRDMRMEVLEGELDGLYDTYKDRLRERDAKFKAKEERSKNKEREKEWNGIQAAKDSEEESTDSEGGWDVSQKNKLDEGDDDTSDDESSNGDSGEGDFITTRKRTRSLKDVAPSAAKRQRLISNLQSPSKPSAAAAQLWFSQGVFAGLGGVDEEIENENEEVGDEDMNERVELDEADEEMDQVYPWYHCPMILLD